MIVILLRLMWGRRMEVKNRLLNFDMFIYQNDDWFTLSLDSVLLANFVTINMTDKKILDLCTGNAPIPLLLSNRTKNKVIGVELQKEIYDLAVKSVKVNKLDSQIELINDDINNISGRYESDFFDIITCNPPFFVTNNDKLLNDNDIKTIARHEVSVCLEDVLKVVNKLLKNGKRFAMVHRPDRLIEIISLMKKYNIEPKKIRFCYPKSGENANILLIEGVKNGKNGLKILAPLIVHNNDGSYTDEVKKMFGE